MDKGPLITFPDSAKSSSDIKQFQSMFASRQQPTMIIDSPSHNSSMPVSPKQGETVSADCLSTQDPPLVSSSMTLTSWELLSTKSTSSPQSAPSSPQSSVTFSQSWSSTPTSTICLPAQIKTVKDSVLLDDQLNTETPCQSWNDSKETLKPSKTSSSESSSPSHLLSPSKASDEHEEPVEHPAVSNSTLLVRNCDQPDSSPSPQSHFSSSFDESEQTGAEVNVSNTESFGSNNANLFGNLERRSRRKPTTGDIIRRIRPPVDAPPYDSEDSEIEDDILVEEMMAKMQYKRHIEDMGKPGLKMDAEHRYRNGSRVFNVDGLSRMEGIDCIAEDDDEDDEEMEVHSESDSSDKHSFLNEVPESIYNLMHEAKVNAHTMFMKTSTSQSPNDVKSTKEQYLLQLLSNLRDKCLDEGLKPEIISAVLKDVETEVTYLSEYLEDIKVKHFHPDTDKESNFNGLDSNDSHFLSKSVIKIENEKDRNEPSNLESYPSLHPSSFFHISSASSPLTATTSSSVSTPDSKPIIVTVSADIKPTAPLMYSRGGLPPYHPLGPNVGDHGLSPMFPNGKMAPWLPPMSMCNFGSPAKLDFAHKFLNLDGKMSDNLDKDYLKCQFCERTFRRQKNLENHIENTHQGKETMKPRRETNDMYFKCSHCPYTTKHQSNLYVHLRIHTGERPYICGACGVQYSQSHSLKSHIINKHDGIMSFYYKEKRARSPRGLGYLSAQVMHDSSMFKLPGSLMGSPMHHNLDIVNKAIEMATSETAKHQQQLMQQHMSTDGNNHRNMMPPTLNSNGNSINNNTSPNNEKSSTSPSSGSVHNTSSIFDPQVPGLHSPFFMNGHPLLFGDLLPPLPDQSGHHPPPHPFLPGFSPFPPTNSNKFSGAFGLSPLHGLSPSSSPALSTPNPHHNLTQHLQLPVHLPRISPSPAPLLQQQQIKKEPSAPQTSPTPAKRPTSRQPDEAIDLRKKSPPLDIKEHQSHDMKACGGKENCTHAAKLKYLRLNVVRMLGILVPNLNFAEKGISAESESVDELLQDVIESNTHEEDLD